VARRCSSVRGLLAVLVAGAALAAAGCSASDGAKVEGPVTVYVSLPLTGPRAADGRDAADGARLALEQAGAKAGELEVRAEYLDDADGAAWDPAAVGANARRAAQDSGAAAYIGELDSQPTRASMPITNDAGIAQISPGAGGVDLTGPAQGYPEAPERYQPSGEPRFARVIPSDSAQVRAAAEAAAGGSAPRVFVESDGSAYQELVASEFEADAADVGVEVVAKPGGEAATLSPTPPGPLSLRGGGEVSEIASPLDPSNLPDGAFAAAFERSFGRPPGPYAAYGHEAMALALQAIAEAADADEDFRGAVVDAMLGAQRPNSVLGSYSITDEGDSTVCAIQPYSVRGDDLIPGKPICPPGA
jgi:branched-chain amino acid transport system substrate-binding protein